MTALESCIVKLIAYGPPFGHTVVEDAEVIHDWVVQDREDGGREGCVQGVKIAGLQDDFCFRVCGDDFGGKIDAGVVRFGMIIEETLRPAGLRKRVAIVKVLGSYLKIS